MNAKAITKERETKGLAAKIIRSESEGNSIVAHQRESPSE